MPLTFQQFKVAVRQRVFPAGESRNLRIAHDKSIVDALVDLQRWVECLQSNNTQLIPHCSTYYNCGLTSFDFPRSIIKRLSVIDKINPETHREDATAEDDYCTEIEYRQIDGCQMRAYLGKSRTIGCCASFSAFLSIPDVWSCGKLRAPVPTDEGVLETLPSLPLGYHYPQVSTNSGCRSRVGVWAKEGGRIYVAPWIQSTETIVLKWDGIKREWVDSDLVSEDPGVLRAVDLFLRWEHARDWDKNPAVGAGYENEYRKALSELMYDCAQEGMVRDCGSERDLGSGGSGRDGGVSPPRTDAGEDCTASGGQPPDPDGGTDGSGGNTSLFYNTNSFSENVSCTDNWAPSGDADPPTGPSVHVELKPGEVSSTVGVSDANTLAENEFEQRKLDALSGQCTFHNKTVSYTATCPDGSTQHTETVAKNDSDCESTVSQAAADGKALAKAKAAALAWMAEDGNCPGDPGLLFCNTAGSVQFKYRCGACPTTTIVVNYVARITSGTSQLDAERNAQDLAKVAADNRFDQLCSEAQAANRCPSISDPRNQIYLLTINCHA